MKKYLIAIVSAVLLAGCYPNGPDYVEQLDIVVSNYDPNFDFSAKSTYSLPDQVVKITGESIDDPDGNGQPDFIDQGTATLILNQLRDNMNARGYTEVDETEDPDLIILPSAMETTTLVYYYDYWYWGWYYPSYPGYGWGWYYPGYYPPAYSSYTTGTLFIATTDPKGLTPDNNVPVVWVGVVNGLLNYGNTTTRIATSIDQLFAQSPYIQH